MNLGSAIQRNYPFYRASSPMPTVVMELERVSKELKEAKKEIKVYNSISRKKKS